MDFTRHQLESDRTLRRLRLAFPLAIGGVVLACNLAAVLVWRLLFAHSPLPYVFLLVNTLATVGLIVAGTLIERRRLLDGSSAIAERLGARPLDAGAGSLSLLERRALDILEEMALAARQPVPRLHVMENDSSINALSIGRTREDGAVVLTRGAIERLDRIELQGVFAHEVARLASGHVAVDSQLGAMTFGLDLVSRAGRCSLHAAFPQSSPGNGPPPAGRGKPVLAIPGVLLLAAGCAGHLAARLLTAATASRGEVHPDSLAVHLTGGPDGLGRALRKIRWMGINGPATPGPTRRAIEMHHGLFDSGRRTRGSGSGRWTMHCLGSRAPLLTRVERLLGQVGAPMPAERSVDDDADLRFHQPREAGWLIFGMFPVQGRAPPGPSPTRSDRHGGLAPARLGKRLSNGDLAALVAASRDGSSAAALMTLLMVERPVGYECWPTSWATAPAFQGVQAARLRRLGPDDVAGLRLPLLELCARTIRPLDRSRKEELLVMLRGQIDRGIPLDGWIRYMLMRTRLLSGDSAPWREGEGATPSAVAVRWMIALLACRTGQSELRAQRLSNDIIGSLGFCRTGQSFPPLDLGGLQVAVASLQRLPVEQRSRLLDRLLEFLPDVPEDVAEFLRLLALILGCRPARGRSLLPQASDDRPQVGVLAGAIPTGAAGA